MKSGNRGATMPNRSLTRIAVLFCGFVFFSTAPFPSCAASKGVSFDEYKGTNLRYCKKLGIKHIKRVKKCIGPGKIGAGVKGKASIITYLHGKTGEVGATLEAKQVIKINFFGKKVKFGLSCQLSKGGKSEWKKLFGYSFSTPSVPAISSNTILAAIVSRGAAAAAGKGAAANVSKSGDMQSTASGFAGTATGKEIKGLMKASGCSLVPNVNIFKGIKSISLLKAGVEFSVKVYDWKVNPKKKTASARLKISARAIAKVGGAKFKIAKKKFHLPGKKFKQKIGDIVKLKISN